MRADIARFYSELELAREAVKNYIEECSKALEAEKKEIEEWEKEIEEWEKRRADWKCEKKKELGNAIDMGVTGLPR